MALRFNHVFLFFIVIVFCSFKTSRMLLNCLSMASFIYPFYSFKRFLSPVRITNCEEKTNNKNFSYIYFIFMCLGALPEFCAPHLWVSGTWGSQRKVLEPPETGVTDSYKCYSSEGKGRYCRFVAATAGEGFPRESVTARLQEGMVFPRESVTA